MLTSILCAAALIIFAALFGRSLPGGELMGGAFYRIIAIILAIIITAVVNKPVINLFKANSLYVKGQIKKALPIYKKAGASSRVSPEMAIYCAYTLLKEKKTEDAEELFTIISKRKLNEKQKLSLETNIALLEWKKGNLDSACEKLASVWERERTAAAGGSLGALLLIKGKESGDYSEAQKICEEAYESFKYDKSVMCNMAELYFRLGRRDEAKEIFDELISMRPDTPAPFYNYALLLIKCEKYADAEDMLNRALRHRFTALTPITKKEVEAALEACSAFSSQN